MLQIVSQMRIFVAREPVDFRRGIDGLAATSRYVLEEEPFNGTVFLFRNRRGNALKILCYDGTGFWLCHKRFSKGTLKWWPKEEKYKLSARELQILFWNGDPQAARYDSDWRKVDQPSLEPWTDR